MGKILSGVDSFATGAMDGLGLSGAAVLRGRAYASFEKAWENSNVEVPLKSYTMNLIPGGGDKMSLLLHQIIPMACVMAASFPRSTGKSSYGSPFLIEMYDQGLAQSKLCLIESFNMTRGEGEVPYTIDGMTTQTKIEIKFKDMSAMTTIPVNDGFSASELLGLNILDDESGFGELTNMITAMSAYDQLKRGAIFDRRVQQLSNAWSSFLSPTHFVNYVVSTPPVRVINAFTRGVI